MFANFVFFTFLLLSAVIFVVLFLLVRQIKKDGRLPPEKMTTLTVLLFLPAIVVFALIFNGLSSWRADIKYRKSRVEVEQFVINVYKPLAISSKSLLQSIADMNVLLDNFDELIENYPNHASLLRKVEKDWRASQQSLYKLYTETDKDIRHAWIAYKTMDQQDVVDKFYTQAVKLNEKINSSDNDYQIRIRNVQDELVASLDQARRLLQNNKQKSKRHKQTSKKKQLQPEKNTLQIKNFNENTLNKLLDFLARLDAGLVQQFERLREDKRIAAQRHAEVMLYLRDNPDLEQPLSKVLNGWLLLQQANHKSQNRILYALEAEYLSLKLGLTEANPAIKVMHETLKKRIPAIVNKAKKQREVLEKSYSIN